MAEAIVLTAVNLFCGYMWYWVGKYVGRYEERRKED